MTLKQWISRRWFILDAETRHPMRCNKTGKILSFAMNYMTLDFADKCNITKPWITRKFRWIPEQFKAEFITQTVSQKTQKIESK